MNFQKWELFSGSPGIDNRANSDVPNNFRTKRDDVVRMRTNYADSEGEGSHELTGLPCLNK